MLAEAMSINQLEQALKDNPNHPNAPTWKDYLRRRQSWVKDDVRSFREEKI